MKKLHIFEDAMFKVGKTVVKFVRTIYGWWFKFLIKENLGNHE